MKYFDRWGTDFATMRRLNKLTSKAYMAQVSAFANIEKGIAHFDTAFVETEREKLHQFKWSLLVNREGERCKYLVLS